MKARVFHAGRGWYWTHACPGRRNCGRGDLIAGPYFDWINAINLATSHTRDCERRGA